jgi:DNA polymerase I
MSDQKHLYLVDGSAYIFRAYHRLPPLTNKHGEPVGAVYGYTTMLWKLADDLNQADGPTHMAVVLDKSSQTFRNRIYDQYKAHRPDPPEDLKPQFPMIRDATRAFSLPLIEEEDVEADDMIASYAKAASAAGWHVTIVSSDKDLMQLVEPSIDMFDTMKNERIRSEEVFEKFGVGPDKVGDVLALMGDSVDNVPGVPGVGPKTATKLIQEFGDLESVLAAAPDMKPSKMRDNLIEHADKARLSKVLVTLKDDCPLPIAMEDMALGAIPEEPLSKFLQHHGFNSLLKRIGHVADTAAANKAIAGNPKAMHAGDGAERAPVTGAPAAPAPMPVIDTSSYECVTQIARLDHWIARARETGTLGFDTETDSLQAASANLVGFSLAVAPGEACYVPLAHGGTDMFAERPTQIPMEAALAKLRPLLCDPSVLKIGQNLKYDMSVLARHNVHITPYDDTMVMSFALDAGRQAHGMDELSKAHLGHECISYKSVTGTGKSQIGFAAVPLSDATRYAAEDADVTLRLWHHLKLRLSPEKATSVYELVDRPLVPVLSKMECLGIKVDRAALARLSSEFAGQMELLEKEIHGLAGQAFTIGSPQQLGEILFGKMGYKGGKKGKSGQYSTDVTVLEDLAGQGIRDRAQSARVAAIGEAESRPTPTACSSRLTPKPAVYTQATALLVHKPGACRRLTPICRTSRSAPKRGVKSGTHLSRNRATSFCRRTIARSNCVWRRILPMSNRCGTPLKRARIFTPAPRLSYSVKSIATRAAAPKRSTSPSFMVFRAGAFPNGWNPLQKRRRRSSTLTSNASPAFPIIFRKRWQRCANAVIRPPSFGRKTWFPRITSPNQAERQGSERAAINAPIQGTSADIIKRAMVQMGPALERRWAGPCEDAAAGAR